MKKQARLLIFILTVAIVVFTAVACLPTSVNTQKKYTVSVELNGGFGVSAESFVKGGKFIEPTTEPVKNGFEFDGWYLDEACESEKAVFGMTLKQDVTVYAKWKKEGKKATFFLGAYTEDLIVREKGGLVTPPEVKRDGYTLLGWYSDKELTKFADFSVAIDDGVVFYAKWEADEYAVSYDLGGLATLSVSAKQTYTVEDAFLLVAPIRIAKGYSFVNWVDENNQPIKSVDKGGVGDRAFKAVFISSNKAVESVKAGTVSENDMTVVIHVPYNISTVNLREYLTVSERAKYQIIDENSVIRNEIELVDGENTGYIATVTAEDGTRANYKITVNRHENTEYTVQYYHLKDGAVTKLREDETVKAAAILGGSLEAEKFTGYVFVGWYLDEAFTKEFYADAPILSDVALYAKYIGAEHDIIYFVGIGTENGNPATYSTGVGLILEAAKAPDGYEFKGWSLSIDTDEFISAIPAGGTDEFTLYAKYALKQESKVVYLEEDAFTDGQELEVERIGDMLNWAIFRRLSEVKFTLTVENATGEEVLERVGDALTNSIVVPFIKKDSISYNSSSIDSKHTITVKLGEFIEPDKTTGKALYKQAAYPAHGVQTIGRKSDFEAFGINSIQNAVEVSDSEQLYFAVENGYRPVPKAGTAAERVYNKAKAVLREIVDDKMSAIDKAHAIFDWLIMNVTYDDELLKLGTQVGEDGKKAFIHDYNGFYLEGVFDDKIAVCDGISKAYVLLCAMEGIECIQVVGSDKTTGVGHAWNKIKIDGKWYVVCPTSGGTIFNGEMEILNHAFFMITDEKMSEKYVENGEYPTANTEYDWFSHGTFTYENKEHKLIAKSRADVIAAAKCAISSSSGLRSFDMKIDYATDDSGLNSAIGEAARALNFDAKKISYNYTKGVLVIIISE